jgi:hypothetical protein
MVRGKQLRLVKIFLASPGDVKMERTAVDTVIAELNPTIAREKGIVFQVTRWERDTYPAYGSDPQSIVNRQIGDMAEHELFVGIMWNRLGTKTPRADSGTVEEFERACDAQKQNGNPEIWFYFRDAVTGPANAQAIEQRDKVLDFKNRVRILGLTFSFKRPAEFRDRFRQQLTLWLTRDQSNESPALPPPPPVQQKAPAAEPVQKEALIKRSPLLRAMSDQIKAHRFEQATATAILSSKMPPDEITAFLLLIAPEAEEDERLEICSMALTLLDRGSAGNEVIDWCLGEGRLGPAARIRLAMRMQYVTSPPAVAWCHAKLTSELRSDPHYNSFLQRHVAWVAANAYDEMAAYLLYPDRGPGSYNVDSFLLAIGAVEDPSPFLGRWKTWIHQERFDGGEGNESAHLLYRILNEILAKDSSPALPVVTSALDYVAQCLGSMERLSVGLYHLAAMIDERFTQAAWVRQNILRRVSTEQWAPAEATFFLLYLTPAMKLLALHLQDPGDSVAESRFEEISSDPKREIELQEIRSRHNNSRKRA